MLASSAREENAMQNETVTSRWERLSDRLRNLVDARRAARGPTPLPGEQESSEPQLTAWEDEGGKTAGRPTP